MPLPLLDKAAKPLPIWLFAPGEWNNERRREAPAVLAWAEAQGFEGKPGQVLTIPDGQGRVTRVLAGLPAQPDPFSYAAIAAAVGSNTYHFASALKPEQAELAALGWALQDYRFSRYRKPPIKAAPRLVWPEHADKARVRALHDAIVLARDLINTPAGDLGPAELADAVAKVAKAHKAKLRIVQGEPLRKGYPLVHMVGRAAAAHRQPRLIDLTWGSAKAPKLTLVGKGVCFDSGGLDIKPASGMLLMKKDMGGAAIMLGLAQAIMARKLNVRLRLLIPAVENAISGDAFRPGDVTRSRKGLTVEIGNTDAEGRLILADALADADAAKPDLLLDAATLTGAARVAVGPDLPALFSPDDALAEALLKAGLNAADPLWRLPLHAPYRDYLDSKVADINNAGDTPFGGAITAALFLKEFVTETRAYAHLDTFGWSPRPRPGRPVGGEATGLRALFRFVEDRFGKR
ncbi:M17 family metallopeptidase [Ferrovibrio sp.]|uniref:leucyl aminopeptidase family protein n=1 Tax=Ferrovibrio sp. TaxID=1917215 RepID=UPI0035B0334A